MRFAQNMCINILGRSRRIKVDRTSIIGRNTVFHGGNRVGKNSLVGGKIGYGTYITENCRIVGEVGAYCSIGSNVRVVQGFHPVTEKVSTHPAFYSTRCQSGFTFVDRDSFDECRYANGVDAVVIGNDVEPYSVVGGVPAKVIKYRFSDEEIEMLLRFRWWDKPRDWISKNHELFQSISRLSDYIKKEASSESIT